MKKTIDDLIGWYGALAILTAYASISFGWTDVNTFSYQILNCTGAMGIVYISFKRKAYQPGFLNVVWMVIALFTIIKMLINYGN